MTDFKGTPFSKAQRTEETKAHQYFLTMAECMLRLESYEKKWAAKYADDADKESHERLKEMQHDNL